MKYCGLATFEMGLGETSALLECQMQMKDSADTNPLI